jgi:oligopeptide transport system substrate-binding protein
MSFLKHRGYLLSLVAIGAVLAFAACGSDDEKTSGTASPGGVAERIQGGTLTVQNLEFQSFDPHFSNFVQDIGHQRMVWRGLYTLDKDNKPQPAMADGEPDVSADGKTYTVKVKEGLKWSDGQPLTAKDFELAVQRTCNPDVASNYQSFASNIVGCDDYFGAKGTAAAPKTPTPDELNALKNAVGAKATGNTVEFKLNSVQPTFQLLLAMWTYFPVPSHLLPDPGEAWPTPPSPKLAYNGPYMVQDYKPQDSMTLVPNPNWAGSIKPTLDKIVMRYIEKNDVADNAYRSGELDEAFADLANLGAVKAEFGDEYLHTAVPGTRAVEMELKHPPLDILEFRLALSQAIDRTKLNEVCCGGAYIATTTFLPEAVGGVAPEAFEAQIGFNADKAKENLAKARTKFGKDFPRLSVLVRDTPEAKAQAEFLQNSWKTILGIDTEIQLADSPTRSKRLNSHDYELAPRSGWIQDYPDPEDWMGKAAGIFNTGGTNNTASCSDPEVDALMEKAATNTNDTERRDQYKQINELVSTRICGYAPYYHEANNWLVKSYVVGMRESSGPQDAYLPGDWMAETWGRSK